MAEQHYEAVRAVIADGETVTSVAARFGVARKTLHQWLAKYEAGLQGIQLRSDAPLPDYLSVDAARCGLHMGG